MTEEGKITMSEFKTVVENFTSQVQKVAEGVMHLSDKLDSEFASVKEQIALLHEGQTEIKIGLKQKIDRDEFSSLERRVTKLENKVA